jgi:ABC-type transport system involved in multi-copper enzyme maturation permease subunit
VPVVALFTLREAVRRKVFVVVLLLTVAFVALYAFGADRAFRDVNTFNGANPPAGIDAKVLAGATLQGLAMFATLFLGTVLAVFLTLSAVRGDAERGLLQPLVVRPVGRGAFLLARFAGAASVCALYVGGLYAVTVVVTGVTGHWWPDQVVLPGLELAIGVMIIVALSLLGSVLLSSTANGIAVFMLFGAGLTAGLLGQVGRAIPSHTLSHVGRLASYALPFEALYQDALSRLTADTAGATGFLLRLGPFGGAQVGGSSLAPWIVAYLVAVAAAALIAFRRADL